MTISECNKDEKVTRFSSGSELFSSLRYKISFCPKWLWLRKSDFWESWSIYAWVFRLHLRL